MPSPSAQIDHYRTTYQRHLARLRAELGDEDRAVEATVGGDFNVFGQIEFDLLVSLGLRPEHSVIDVGCGCGRLAFFLRDYTRASYTGIDIIPELAAYGRKKVGRTDWNFVVGDGAEIPLGTAKADFICFFSVLTHLSLEDGYRYLENASHFLNPGGLMVVSFLDFTIADHWPHFLASLADPDPDRVGVQYLSRDTMASWAARLGLTVCALLDSDRLQIPISRPLKWQNGNVTTGTISIGQSVAVLGAGPNPVSESALGALGASEIAAGSASYRTLLESVAAKARDDARDAARRAAAAAHDADQQARLAHHENRDCILRLRADIEALHARMRALEQEWAVEKGRADALARSWLPGKYLSRRLPGDEFFHAQAFGDNGADLHGPPVTYYLYTSPYRIWDPGKNTLTGWCFAQNETVSGVRVRLGEAEFAGHYGVETRPLTAAEPDAFGETRNDGFRVDFEIPSPGRHFLRVEANLLGKGWRTFVSCPIWAILKK